MIDDNSKNGTNDNQKNDTAETENKNKQTLNVDEKTVNADEKSVDDNKQNSADEADSKDEQENKKLAKIIPFNPDPETEMTKEAAQEAMDDAVRNIKTAFNDLKQQLSPLAASFREVAEALRDTASEARKSFSVILNNEENKNDDYSDNEDKINDENKNDDDDNEDKKTADEDNKNEDRSNDEINENETKTNEDDGDNSNDDEDKKENEAVTVTRETTAAITEGINRLKERVANGKLNIANILSDEFNHYADENLSEEDYTIDEDGKRVVTLNGDFMHSHGNEFIPAMIRGTVGTFLKTLLGTDITGPEENEEDKKDDNEESTDSANINRAVDKTDKEDTDRDEDNQNTADNAEKEADDGEDKKDDAPTNDENKYRVQFDFANALANMVKNAKIVPNENEEPVNEHDMERSRALLIEGTKLTEDALNGKSVDDAEERIDRAIDEVDRKYEADSQRPEDIEAIDEKHRKILEISKQFEQNMSDDPINNDK